MPQTPSWIAPADPVASTAKGLQLGMQMGSEQAAQRFQEQQMMRKEQENAQAQAQWEAEYGLRAAEVARKHTAMQEYQRRIAAGEDPLKVILEVGPSIGVGGAAEAAAIRAQNQKPAPTWSLIPGLPQGVQALQSSAGGIHVVPTPRVPVPWQQNITQGGIPGQQQGPGGKFEAYKTDPSASLELRKDTLANRYAQEIDKLITDFGGSGDFTDDNGKPATDSAHNTTSFKHARGRYLELKKKIEGLQSGAATEAEPAPPAANRVNGKRYSTPKGTFIWTGSGWLATQ